MARPPRSPAGGPAFASRLRAVTMALVLAAIAGMAAVAMASMARLNRDAALSSLGVTAAALANAADMGNPDAFCRSAARDTGLRLTIVAADGTVLGDSRGDPSLMENHAGREELAAALAGRPGSAVRRSPTLGAVMAYAAAPILRDGLMAGALRAAMDLPELGARLGPFLASSLAAAAAFAALAALAALTLAARLGSPVTALAQAARRWSAGELSARAPEAGLPELAALGAELNGMAAELALRIEASERLARELRAVLDALGEGLIALDPDLRVTQANPRAVADLGVSGGLAGLHVLEATGSAALGELAARCAASGAREEAELRVFGKRSATLMANAEPMPWPDGRVGVVLALTDVTRLKRLEAVRKDFVSNVSHELRTPITLIKGFLEAMDGADPADAERFVGIMRRHAQRMETIVADLLSLARLESDERPRLALSPVGSAEVVDRAIEAVRPQAEARGCSFAVSASPGLSVMANEGLLEQALVNLLQNAVRYGPPGAAIRIEAGPAPGGMVAFTVSDQGPGIPERDRERIFERFYRVDRGRSKELGGTGLGLAIVRHIALAHGGEARVRSREGEGSSFTVTVPAAQSDAESVQ